MAKRTSPGQTAPDFTLPDELPEVAEPQGEIAKAADLGFWSYIDSLSQAECEKRVVGIYRLTADGSKEKIVGSDKTFKEIIPLPMDANGYPCLHNYITEKFGGGRYELYLNIRVEGQRLPKQERHLGSFWVDGPPKYPVLAGGEPPVLNAATGQPVPAPVADNADMTRVVNRLLDELGERERGKVSPDSDLLAQSAVKAVGVVTEILGAAAKKDAAASDPLDQMSKILDIADKVRGRFEPPAAPPPAPPANPIDQMKSALELAAQLQAMVKPAALTTAAPSETAGGGALGGVKVTDLLELFRTGHGDLARDILLGQQEKPGFMDVLLNAGMKLGDRPDVLSKIGDAAANLINIISLRLTSSLLTGSGDAVASGNPAPGNAALLPAVGARPSTPSVQDFLADRAREARESAATQAAQPGAEASSPDGQVLPVDQQDGERGPLSLEETLQYLLPMLAGAMARGDYGDRTAEHVAGLFPEVVAPLTEMFEEAPDETILALLRTQPAIAPAMRSPLFLQFFADFKSRILQGFEDEFEQESGEVLKPAMEPAIVAQNGVS